MNRTDKINTEQDPWKHPAPTSSTRCLLQNLSEKSLSAILCVARLVGTPLLLLPIQLQATDNNPPPLTAHARLDQSSTDSIPQSEQADQSTNSTNNPETSQSNKPTDKPETASPQTATLQESDIKTDQTTEDVTREAPSEPADVLLVVGAGGTSAYEEDFSNWESEWRELATSAGANYQSIGLEKQNGEGNGALTDRDAFWKQLDQLLDGRKSPLWIIFIGHGTYTRGVAKFNMRGPDISAEDLQAKLNSGTRPLIFLNFSSASGPFINALSEEGRVVLTATKNGDEQNYSRFGGYFVESLRDPTSDLDHDHQVSVLEAFIAASARTKAYYDSEQRIMTEHALIDDNGDQLGTPANFFRGIRVAKKTKPGTQSDGRRSSRQNLTDIQQQPQFTREQRTQRDRYEEALDQIVQRRSEMSDAEYLSELESVLIPLSKLYQIPKKADAETRSEN